MSQKNSCVISYLLDKNDNKLYYFTCVLRTKFCVPDSDRFTELAAVRKSFNNFLLPLLLFTQHQLVHAQLIHTSTEKQKNTIQLFLLFFHQWLSTISQTKMLMIHLIEHARAFTIFTIAHNPPCLPYALFQPLSS